MGIPFFAAFEGIDYSGKNTHLRLLENWLIEKGFSVDVGSEPVESTPIGKQIRVILEHKIPAPAPYELQRLFVIDRAQDIVCFIKPALEKGSIVLRERYALSTLAYGMLSKYPVEDYIQLHNKVIGQFMLWPDITFVLDISAEEAVRRMEKAKAVPQLFEKKEKLEVIRRNYLTLAERSDLGKVVVIDGEREKEEVFKDVVKSLVD